MTTTTNTINAAKMTAAMRKEIAAALLRFSLSLEERMRMNIRDGGGVYTGALMGSIAAKPPQQFAGGVLVEVGTPLEQGVYYELGTQPHWAPIEPLRRWVELKLQPHVQAVGVAFIHHAGKSRAVPSRTGSKILRGDKRVQAVMAAARAIQRKIASVGTKPHFFMANALKDLGAPYEIAPDGSGGMTYHVDLGGYLEKNEPNLWARIAGAMQSGGAS